MSNAKKWTFKDQFPSNSDFVNRITGAVVGKSNSGNPMVTVTCEVVTPAEVQVGEDLLNIAGVKTTNWFVLKSYDADGTLNDDKTAKAQERFKAFYGMVVGLDSDEYANLDMENPDTKPLLGKLLLTQMSPDVEPQRKNPTSEQIQKAKKENTRVLGDVQKHPVTGKDLISYRPQIREFFAVTTL